MFFKRHNYHYSPAEIHNYVADMEKVVSMQKAVTSGKAHAEYEVILRVMRQVLQRMVETLAPEERQQVKAENSVAQQAANKTNEWLKEQTPNGTTSNR